MKTEKNVQGYPYSTPESKESSENLGRGCPKSLDQSEEGVHCTVYIRFKYLLSQMHIFKH